MTGGSGSGASGKDAFPFSAVVGQDEARLALLLAAVDPGIGGVLLRGEKGSAKSTLARGLAALLPDCAPFVELPVGATEDRVLGSLDLRAALSDGPERFRPGLLAAAHGGVLYVDEVNLLPDHLVDAILDAAASGVHRVERDGISHEHPARFVLLGSMNPEEGELRPQLLDRFGLSVEIRSPQDPTLRAEAVRRRLAHDHGRPVGTGTGNDDELRRRLVDAAPATLPDHVVEFASRLAVNVGAESLRADLVLCRAGAALAGWEGRAATGEDDVARVAPLALGHRHRRRPFDPPTLPPDALTDALTRSRAETADDAERSDRRRPTGDLDDSPAVGHAPERGRPGYDDDGTWSASEPGLRGSHTRPNATGPGSDAVGKPDAGPRAATDDHRERGEDRPGTDQGGHERTEDPRGDQGGWSSRGSGPASSGRRWTETAGGTDTASGGRQAAPEGRWDELAQEASKARLALEALAPTPIYARGQRSQRPAPARSGSGRGLVSDGGPGRAVGHRLPGPDGADGIAVVPTVRAALQRRELDPEGPVLAAEDVRAPRRVRKQGRTIVLVVDASGSMGTIARVAAATGAVLGLLADAYLRRDQVALVAFRGDGATEVLPPTASVELARSHLAELPTGGATPLAEGLAAALRTAGRATAQGSVPLLVVLTDGRATGSPDALDRARDAARAVAASGIEAVVLDAEDGDTRLGLAAELVALMDGRYLHLATVTADAVETAVRATLEP